MHDEITGINHQISFLFDRVQKLTFPLDRFSYGLAVGCKGVSPTCLVVAT